MDILVLLLFCAVLTFCVIFKFSIIYALIIGLAIFGIYAKCKKFTLRQIFAMIMQGVKTVKNVLIILVFIGVLTALWRSCGTIPIIICYAVRLITPAAFVLMAFLLNCFISVLTGTAFGTAATMGVICMTMGNTMGIEPMILGGAILAGTFFGDRCSPVSTSALLVSELTQTSIYKNIKNMVRSAFFPFAAACAVYAAVGFFTVHGESVMDLNELFGRAFNLHWAAFIPAALILLLSLLRVNVMITMGASIAAAVFVSLFAQHNELSQIFHTAVFGYEAADAGVAAMMNGGGVLSMVSVIAIVCISSAYAGIFQKTGLLNAVQSKIKVISDKVSPYGASFFTAALTAMITCNQTLSIMLTHQLCEDFEPNKEEHALNIENSAAITSTLIPWSIGATVPLASIGAPLTSILFACYLYFQILWSLSVSIIKHKKNMQQPH